MSYYRRGISVVCGSIERPTIEPRSIERPTIEPRSIEQDSITGPFLEVFEKPQ
jgi:hypothetical protein